MFAEYFKPCERTVNCIYYLITFDTLAAVLISDMK